MAAVVETSTKLMLDKRSDWRRWIQSVELVATGGRADVWAYIDPSKAEVPQAPVSPDIPSAPATPPAASAIATAVATTAATADLSEQWRHYKARLNQYEKAKEGLGRVQLHILTTVTKDNLVFINRKKTVHKILLALKAGVAPSEREEQERVRYEYWLACRYNKKEKIETWLLRWEKTYQEAVRLDLPEVKGSLPIFDFLTAMEPYQSAHVAAERTYLDNFLEDFPEKEVPAMSRFLQRFRRTIAMSAISKATTEHSAFAVDGNRNTYKENTPNRSQNHSRNTRGRPKPKCLCGIEHFYSECWYFNADSRPSKWQANKEIQKKVNEHLLRPETKALVNTQLARYKERKEKEKKGETSVVAATTHFVATTMHQVASTGKDHQLYRAWILDGGSNIHIMNHREGFMATRGPEPGETVGAGTQTFYVQEYGTIDVTIQTPVGKGRLTLVDVAYIPGFITSIISQDRLVDRGLYWSTQKLDVLTKNNKVIINLEQIGRHQVFQSNLAFQEDAGNESKGGVSKKEFEYAAGAARKDRKNRSDRGIQRSKEPVERILSADMAHKILGHASPEIIRNLEKSVKGLKLEEGSTPPESIDCETCSLAKPTRIISRRSETEEKDIETMPGESWSWDLIYEVLAYNGSRYCSHFQDLNTKFNLVYIQESTGQTLDIMREAFNLIKTKYRYTPKHILLDSKRTLQKQ